MDKLLASSNLIALAHQWWMFGQMLVVCARRVIALQRSGSDAARHEAETLELYVRTAHVALSRQICVAYGKGDTLSPEEANALVHLHRIWRALLTLTFTLQYLKLHCVRRARALGSDTPRSRDGASFDALVTEIIEYFDTS